MNASISVHMRKKENTFLLLSLEEGKAKKLANVIGSDACRKILDLLAQQSATETQISTKLSMPLSTVHYNIQQLLKSGLVKADEFHYSEKGREVDHYSIANKYIIIAPKSVEGLAEKLKKVLPVFAFVAVTGAVLDPLSRFFGNPQVSKAAESIPRELASGAVQESVRSAADFSGTAVTSGPTIGIWFVLGALFALIVYVAYDFFREKGR
jgi:predicted transcriptional regulator